jgi:DHA2 family multidrug resistance protein
LGPAGAITFLILPIVGKATERIDARLLLAVGLTISAYAVYYMSGFTLDIDFTTASMGRVIQGIGMPFFFVSLSYSTMAYVTRQQMNNASAIFNLLRNLGGSSGVAFVTTLLARRAQFHQYRLVEHLTPFDPNLTIRSQHLRAALDIKLGTLADHSQQAAGMVYQYLVREATSLAFNDTFFVQTLLFLSLVALLWLMRKPPIGKHMEAAGH